MKYLKKDIPSDLLKLIFEGNDNCQIFLLDDYIQLVFLYNSLVKKYNQLLDSKCWRITSPIRILLDKIKVRKSKKLNIPSKHYWQKRHDFYIPYQAFGMRKKDFDSQVHLSKVSTEPVKFSILVPLYNTSEEFLKEMIGSVLGQTYSNWELCLADASDCEHDYVRLICEQIEKNDTRIKYKKIEKNLGISANTNECLKLASGDYFSLLDHDDILHPSALFETYKMIEAGADFIYSDEAIFESPKLYKIKDYHIKKDFSQSLLETNNYICHFTTFSKELLGDYVFDPDCDGAQDYDIILKLTERAKSIKHIKKVIYYWRAHPQSTAYSTNAKSYTSLAGKKALEKHFFRINQKAIVIMMNNPNTYATILKHGDIYEISY